MRGLEFLRKVDQRMQDGKCHFKALRAIQGGNQRIQDGRVCQQRIQTFLRV